MFRDLDWRLNFKGNYVSKHPKTGETVTVFKNRYGDWSGVWNGEYIVGYFMTPEETCEQMERWFAGEDVLTSKGL
jgi:hypothetical protein